MLKKSNKTNKENKKSMPMWKKVIIGICSFFGVSIIAFLWLVIYMAFTMPTEPIKQVEEPIKIEEAKEEKQEGIKKEQPKPEAKKVEAPKTIENKIDTKEEVITLMNGAKGMSIEEIDKKIVEDKIAENASFKMVGYATDMLIECVKTDMLINKETLSERYYLARFVERYYSIHKDLPYQSVGDFATDVRQLLRDYSRGEDLEQININAKQLTEDIYDIMKQMGII